MIDHEHLKASSREWWERQPTDQPFSLNSFNGTFAFSDHSLVPELIRDLVLSQRNEDKFTKVPLDAITDIANSFWNGPGSCAVISDVIWDARIARAYGANFTESKNAYKFERSVADWERIEDEKGVSQ